MMIQRLFFLACLAFTCCVAHEPELLKDSDISRIMSQILDQHLGNQEVTGKILQSSLRVFINQFDPHRMYLLVDEVAPYDQLSETDLAALQQQYSKGDYSVFIGLNDVFQRAILRSRAIRATLETKEKMALFKTQPAGDQVNALAFVNSVDELKQRILNRLEAFIVLQTKTFGEAVTTHRKDHILRLYENELKDFENQYLYQNANGEPLPEAEKNNLFAIHVLKALASSLDAHTSFYGSTEAYDMRVRLQKGFQGVGMFLKDSPDGPLVASLVPGGSAAASGLIKPGDALIKVDGEDISDLPIEKVMEKLRDREKPDVVLELKRTSPNKETELIKATLKRQDVVVNTNRVDVSSEKFGNGLIGMITLHSFYQGNGVSSEEDVRKAIETLQKQGNLRGLILDLRENGGGFLSQAVKVAGLFITNGVIVISKYANGDEHFYRDVDGKVAYNGPLVILTSKATASAAEIVAQALQDYGVALVVGDEHTYGKGTIQTQTVTDNQSSSYFKVTVGKYYTVSGQTPQKSGVKADIIAPSRWYHERIGEEYLNSPQGDTIQPSYTDTLEDVTPDLKSWYLKYYIPTLQHRETRWRAMLPTLTKNSEYRIAHNKNYQYFLKGESGAEENEEEDSKAKKTYGIDDLQMQEAVNVVKDMILLRGPKNHS